MTDVDEILASGRYTDRRGRAWEICRVKQCCEPGEWWNYSDMARNNGRHHTADQMRLLIERDLHRDECRGIGVCTRHSVPHVAVDVFYGGYIVSTALNEHGGRYSTLAGAMDAARALAVKS